MHLSTDHAQTNFTAVVGMGFKSNSYGYVGTWPKMTLSSWALLTDGIYIYILIYLNRVTMLCRANVPKFNSWVPNCLSLSKLSSQKVGIVAHTTIALLHQLDPSVDAQSLLHGCGGMALPRG